MKAKAILAALLTAICAAMTSLTAFAVVDELGYIPEYWYLFSNGTVSLGAYDLTWKYGSTDTSHKAFGSSGFEGEKCAAVCTAPGDNGHGYGLPNSGDWTIVVRGRMDSADNTILVCIGYPDRNRNNSSVSITTAGEGKVALSALTGNSQHADLYTADVSSASQAFHLYALQYNSSKGKLSFWIDGRQEFETSRNMNNDAYRYFKFFGCYNGVPSNSGFVNGDATQNSAISDFRCYTRLLTAAELSTLAHPPLDEIGYRPALWYSFNGTVNAESAGFLPSASFTNCLVSYTRGRDNGVTNSAATASGSTLFGSGMPWGANAGVDGGNWTIVLDLKGEDTENAVYFATGDGAVDTCFALVSGGAGKVKLVKYSGAWPFADAFTVDVPDASNVFHQYAIVRSSENIQLYIDGVLKGEERRDNPQDGGFTVFKSPGGNGANGIYDAMSSVIDDFRMYKRALTQAELDAIRSASHDELGGTPTHWYKFDGSLESSGRRELAFEGAFSGAAFCAGDDGSLLATGDKPFGTNIVLRANNWTILVKAKSEDTDNAVLASFGSSLSTASSSVALTSAGAGRVAMSAFSGGAVHADRVTAEVANASSRVHTYALVRNGDSISLWVDAVLVGDTVRPDPTHDGFAFFGVCDGLGETGLVAPSAGASVADFRVYDRALTESEQIAVSRSTTATRGFIITFY